MPQLVVLAGPLKGNSYPLDLERWGTDELVLGRSKDCQILLHDSKVSKRHVRLFVENQRWFVEDLGSRNGMQVNGSRAAREMLSDGDEIQVGSVVFSYREEAASRRAAAKPAAPASPVEPAEPADPTADATPTQPSESSPPRPRIRVPRGDADRPEVSKTEMKETVVAVRKARDLIRTEIGRVVVGQTEVIDDLLVALLARGHCLLEGVPGLAKTLLVSTLAAVLDLDFKRIQFTPDLMPADITGTDVLEEDPSTRERSYKFLKGPIFANILLADEINRTPPKTQSALLEAMQEFRVTAAGTTYSLTPPFYVLATQNPIEQEGTYPLPEAQLDRFMFKIRVGYPSRDEEVDIVRSTTTDSDEEPDVVLGAGDILRLQKLVRKIPVSDYVVYYATDLARATRPLEQSSPDYIQKFLAWGAGPRAAQYLTLGAKARALLDGRVNVSVDDVRSVAPQVLRHRVSLNFHGASEGLTTDDLVERLLETLPAPTLKGGGRP